MVTLRDVAERYRGIIDVEAAMRSLEGQLAARRRELADVTSTLAQQQQVLSAEIARLKFELAPLSAEEYFASYGIYRAQYEFDTSERYKQALEKIREQQRSMIKAGTAAVCRQAWVVGGSAKEGERMTRDNLNLMIRAFNGEADAAITTVNHANFGVIERRIYKARETIDRLNKVNQAELTDAYVQSKIAELRLFHEYEQKKQAEREEQRRIKEEMREEKRAQQELERATKQAAEEERRYADALQKARDEVREAVGAKQQRLLAKIEELEKRAAEASVNKERAISRAQQTRSGHVYVISNVGSFGENVFKIGMTRRLDPFERVRELGDASVPFAFDVHAIIYSDDAPGLEAELHRRFTHLRVNVVNERKEFFRVGLDAIATVARELRGDMEFTMLAEAFEYREGIARRQRAAQGPAPSDHLVAAM
jgi:hypothetical protein